MLTVHLPWRDLEAAASASNTQRCDGVHAFYDAPVYVHLLASGEAQVRAYDVEGHLYTFIWTP